MSPERSPLVIGVVVGVAVLLCGPAAEAESCSAGLDTQGAFARADAVFLGVLDAYRPSAAPPGVGAVARVRTLRSWKGSQYDHIAFSFDVHARWPLWQALSLARQDTVLVFAKRGLFGLTHIPCLNIGLDRLVTHFGPGTVPQRHRIFPHLWFWWPWYALAVIFLAPIGVRMRRRRPLRGRQPAV